MAHKRWDILHKLARRYEKVGEAQLATIVLEELVNLYPYHGIFRASLRMQLAVAAKKGTDTAISCWTRLSVNNPCQIYFHSYLGNPFHSNGHHSVVVHIADIETFRYHEGFDVIPVNPHITRGSQKVFRSFNVDFPIRVSKLYERMVASRTDNIRLWILQVRDNQIIRPFQFLRCDGTCIFQFLNLT